ncbi:hypothetical protein DSO57_1031992 [Entomophthora muscae]|uniref:Uncharacterized protein n=1 Tax=Entomophthora muscae TaxID=34485 RepID=A0ACC2S2Q8_9FUNG|nr:hypothetical protein DSO57_1031992 [Entomophthora muscae]
MVQSQKPLGPDTLTGLIDSALPAAGHWAVAGKALSYLVKLGPIIWWTMPVPASTSPSHAEALCSN